MANDRSTSELNSVLSHSHLQRSPPVPVDVLSRSFCSMYSLPATILLCQTSVKYEIVGGGRFNASGEAHRPRAVRPLHMLSDYAYLRVPSTQITSPVVLDRFHFIALCYTLYLTTKTNDSTHGVDKATFPLWKNSGVASWIDNAGSAQRHPSRVSLNGYQRL